MSFTDRQLGDKLGPRLANLMAMGTIAARRQTAAHDARALAVALNTVIDKMGHEHAELADPIVSKLLERGELPAELREMFETAASGEHQWQSRAVGQLIYGTAGSALGTIISNYLFPITKGFVALSPHLVPDPGTLAQLVAHGWAGDADAAFEAAGQGINGGWFQALVNASHTWLDPGTLIELERRGDLGPAGFFNYLRIAGYEAQTIAVLRGLIRQWLSPAEAALAVLRGNMPLGEGVTIAAKSGITEQDFNTIVANTGEPLGLMQLLEAYRRGFINQAKLERGIRQSRVRDEWIPTAIELRYQPMSTADAADAWLRGHLPEAAAQQIAELNGLRPQDWPAYAANQGNPPADMQLLELWRRGFATESQVDQGLRQGRLRDTWIPFIKHLKTVRMPTADVIDAWLRGHIDQADATGIIEQNGLDPKDIPLAFGNAGNPLGLMQLLEAYRRKFIDKPTFIKGFRESRYRNEWADTALELRYRPMTAVDAIEASVQGYLTEKEARDISELDGLLPAHFDPMYRKAGEPLDRTELQELFNRGKISLEVYRQALRESRLKDKYIDDALELRHRIPSEFQIQRLLALGIISSENAIRLLMDNGYTHEVAAYFATEAEVTATGEHRHLLAREIATMYENHVIGRGRALELLTADHFTEDVANLILDLADHQRDHKILNTGIAGIRKLFLAYRIDATNAKGDLLTLGVGSEGADLYLRAWRVERAHTVKELTEAQVIKMYKRSLFDPHNADKNREIACQRLTRMGYSTGDASLLIEAG